MATKSFKPNAVYMLVNRRSGLVLQAPAQRGGFVRQEKPEGTAAQLWAAVAVEEDIYRLQNPAGGLWLDTVYSGTVAGTWADAWDSESESQLWRVSVAARGYRKLTNVHSGRVLDIALLSRESDTPAQLWDDVGGENQQWKLVEYPSPEATALITGAQIKTVVRRAAAQSGKLLGKTEDALSDVAARAKPAVKKAGRATKKAMRDVAAKAEDATRELRKTVKKTARTAKPKVDQAIDKIKDAGEQVIDAAEDWVEARKETKKGDKK